MMNKDDNRPARAAKFASSSCSTQIISFGFEDNAAETGYNGSSKSHFLFFHPKTVLAISVTGLIP